MIYDIMVTLDLYGDTRVVVYPTNLPENSRVYNGITRESAKRLERMTEKYKTNTDILPRDITIFINHQLKA